MIALLVSNPSLAAINAIAGSAVLWLIFAVLLALAWWASPPGWLKPLLALFMSVVFSAAIVVTVTASGAEINDLIAVLNQLGIKSP